MKKRDLPVSRLLDDRWFTKTDRGLVMAASRCPECGTRYFPPKRMCPDCFVMDGMETVPLSSRGTLYSFTVAELGPPEFEAPYAFGLVDLPEGLRVFTLLVDCAPFDEKLRIGAEVELSIGPIKRDAFGVQLIGYRFRPVGKEVRQ